MDDWGYDSDICVTFCLTRISLEVIWALSYVLYVLLIFLIQILNVYSFYPVSLGNRSTSKLFRGTTFLSLFWFLAALEHDIYSRWKFNILWKAEF